MAPPIFTRSELATSPNPPISLIVAFSPEFAALGLLSAPVSLLSTLNKHYPLHGLDVPLAPLNLAFAAAQTWPTGTPDSAKSSEALATLAEECATELWPMEIPTDKQTDDEAGLKQLLALIEQFDKGAASLGEDEEMEDVLDPTEFSDTLAKALDLAIKLGCEGKEKLDERSAGLLKKISLRLGEPEQIEALGKSARAWPFLLKGALAKVVGVDEGKLKALGEEVTGAVQEWFEKGPQLSEYSKKDLKELLQVCDAKTREVWPEGAGEDHPKPETLFAKKVADEKEIEKVEKKLEVKLPKDYKEFLGITNGFGRVLADDVFEAPLFEVERLEWQDASEAAGLGDEDDDEDDDEEEDDEEPEGPPAKKVKMMDGNKLLAIAKEAEKKRNASSGNSSSAPAAEDAEMDEDEDDEALEAALAGAISYPNLKVELLTLPDMMFEALADEHDDIELPDIGKVVVIGGDEGTSFWLLPPEQVKAARDAYIKMYERVDEHQKTVLRWAMIGFAGSEEAFRKYDGWAFAGWASGEMAEMQVWASFRKYVEDMAENSEKLAKDEAEKEGEDDEDEDEEGCFAYRLR